MIEIIKSKATDKLEMNNGLSTFLNPYSYIILRKETDLISQFDNIYIDGQWLCNFLKVFKVKSLKRTSFDNSSIAKNVLASANNNKKNVGFIGSDSKSQSNFICYIEQRYPNINIVYSRHGYFSSADEAHSVAQEVAKVNPDILIIGMGALNQEKFLIKVKNNQWNGIGYTCGGFFHQTSDKGHHYYPKIIDQMHLRFAYRIYDEPKLIKRYTLDYGKFLFLFIYDVFSLKIKEKEKS